MSIEWASGELSISQQRHMHVDRESDGRVKTGQVYGGRVRGNPACVHAWGFRHPARQQEEHIVQRGGVRSRRVGGGTSASNAAGAPGIAWELNGWVANWLQEGGSIQKPTGVLARCQLLVSFID